EGEGVEGGGGASGFARLGGDGLDRGGGRDRHRGHEDEKPSGYPDPAERDGGDRGGGASGRQSRDQAQFRVDRGQPGGQQGDGDQGGNGAGPQNQQRGATRADALGWRELHAGVDPDEGTEHGKAAEVEQGQPWGAQQPGERGEDRAHRAH